MTAEEKVLNRLRVTLLERIQRIAKRQRQAIRQKRWARAAELEDESAGVAWAIADLDDLSHFCRTIIQ